MKSISFSNTNELKIINIVFLIPLLFLSSPGCNNSGYDKSNQKIADSLTTKKDSVSDFISSLTDSSIIKINEFSNGYNSRLDFPVNDENIFIDGDLYNLKFNPTGNYNDLKNQIAQKRTEFQKNWEKALGTKEKEMVINSARTYITETLINKIFPFWYGTKWSLSGYSEVPNQGETGCSYFVSNTLKHMGFKVNRYKLAQQNSRNIPQSVQMNDSLTLFTNIDKENFINKFPGTKKEGLYIIGLDCHVGYLLARKNELFFIHSSYAYPLIVQAEFVKHSKVFSSANYFIADFTTNNSLIINWLENKELKIVTD
ncbi:MAG: hypothetical protein U0W24_05420 [Bacteroidales bacterium]